jgi:D-alanyl-D-alanine carboxypeptidase/D-alanyl-D-alanine-endopeptidase (penicillin-binding protein 4)
MRFLPVISTAFIRTLVCLAVAVMPLHAAGKPDPALLAPLKSLEKRGIRVSADFATEGREVASLNADRMLNPASVTKLFTAAVALHVLGAGRTWDTTVHVSGKGAAARDIAISSRGNPVLTSKDLTELAACVRESGVASAERLTVVLDPFDRSHVPPAFDQKKGDHAYRAGIAGFQVDRSAIVIAVKPGQPGKPPIVTVTPLSDAVRIENTAVTASPPQAPKGKARGPEVQVSTEVGQDGRMVVRVSGRAHWKRAIAVTRRVPDPAVFAGGAFKSALAGAGVAVKGRPTFGAVPKGARVVCSRPSPAMREILLPVLKDSINSVAETVLRWAGAEGAARPVGFQEGARVLDAYLKTTVGLDPKTYRFTNGSGLYDANRVSARGIVRLLAHARQDPGLAALGEGLAVGGVDGTLKKRFRGNPLKGRVRAKTGTLDNAIALAGYLDLPGGSTVDFAILANAVPCPADGTPAPKSCGKLPGWAVRQAMDQTLSLVWDSLATPHESGTRIHAPAPDHVPVAPKEPVQAPSP